MRRRKKQISEMPLFDHFKALRKVLLISAYAIAFGTVIGWGLSDIAYRFLAQPMSGIEEVQFITTTPLEPVFVKLRISLVVGLVVALPIVVWQIWSFVLPALQNHEKKYLYVMAPSSFFLFLSGAAFAFFLVLPIGLRFLMFVGGGAVDSTPFVTKSSYLTFILTFVLSFGLVFQMPIVLLLLIKLGYLSPRTLAKYRRYAFFIIIVLAVVISPTPDIMTQFLMAGPMYMLYELSIWIGYLLVRKSKKQIAQENSKEEG